MRSFCPVFRSVEYFLQNHRTFETFWQKVGVVRFLKLLGSFNNHYLLLAPFPWRSLISRTNFFPKNRWDKSWNHVLNFPWIVFRANSLDRLFHSLKTLHFRWHFLTGRRDLKIIVLILVSGAVCISYDNQNWYAYLQFLFEIYGLFHFACDALCLFHIFKFFLTFWKQ